MKSAKSKLNGYMIISLLTIIFLSYRAITKDDNNSKTKEISEEITNLKPLPEYKIEKVSSVPGVKKTYLIRLKNKIPKDVLENIAVKITSGERSKYERIFIDYYLPGMKEGSGAWATTHFNPDLKVVIIGFTGETQIK